MNFDLADLRAFVAVADMGSFHAAADMLHISPPALSRRIQKLEEVLGVRLFDRTTRVVKLTVTGREFAPKARSVLDDLESALLGIREVAATRTGEITIACVPSALGPLALDALTRHRARSPNIRVRTMNGSATYVLSAVIKAEAEFGLNFIGVDEPEIDFEPLVRDPYVLICRKDDALAQHENVKWSQLATRVLISGWKGSGNRLTLDLALATHLPRLCWSYEVKRLSTIPNLVEGGLGIAVVPRLLIQESGHPTLACIPLVDPIVVRTIGLIHKRGRALSSPARQLYDLIAAAHAPAHTLAV